MHSKPNYAILHLCIVLEALLTAQVVARNNKNAFHIHMTPLLNDCLLSLSWIINECCKGSFAEAFFWIFEIQVKCLTTWWPMEEWKKRRLGQSSDRWALNMLQHFRDSVVVFRRCNFCAMVLLDCVLMAVDLFVSDCICCSILPSKTCNSPGSQGRLYK